MKNFGCREKKLNSKKKIITVNFLIWIFPTDDQNNIPPTPSHFFKIKFINIDLSLPFIDENFKLITYACKKTHTSDAC